MILHLGHLFIGMEALALLALGIVLGAVGSYNTFCAGERDKPDEPVTEPEPQQFSRSRCGYCFRELDGLTTYTSPLACDLHRHTDICWYCLDWGKAERGGPMLGWLVTR